MVVVVPNCFPLSGSEFEAEALENTHAAVPVSSPVPTDCLAEVVEEGDDRNTVGGEQRLRVRYHVVVHLNGVLSKPTVFLVVLITPTSEVARRLEVVDDGLDARAPGSAENTEDPVFDVLHTFSNTTIAKRSFRCDYF